MKTIEEGVDEFAKIVLDLEELEVKVDNEVKAIILLNSLSKQFRTFKETMKYGQKTLSVDFILKSLNSKVLEIKKHLKESIQSEALVIRGKFKKQDLKNFKNNNNTR